MTLFDRYLHAVRTYLPMADQDDIIRELSEDLHAQAADREAEVGRPLTASEQKALLKQFGHPMLLAAKYRPRQHLIGPTVFPIYWHVLKIALIGMLLVQAAIAVAMFAGGTSIGDSIARIAAFPFKTGVTVFGWVTLAFVLVDWNLAQLGGLGSWDPETLPVVSAPAPASRLASTSQAVASSVLLGWWLLIPRFPVLVFGPAADFLALSPAFQAVHLPIAGLWLAAVITMWVLVFRPVWNRSSALPRLVADTFGIMMAAVLLRAEPLVALSQHASPPYGGEDIVSLVNLAVRLGLIAFFLVSVVEVLRRLWKLQRPDGKGSPERAA